MRAADDIYDPTDPATIADPYTALARLRAERPVAWSERLKAWLLTRYDDCLAAQRNRRFSAERMADYFDTLQPDRRERLRHAEDALRRWAVFLDPPEHTRIRSHLNGRFTTAALAATGPRIARRIDALLAPALPAGAMDFVADFAYPLPAGVIMEMLGVPEAHLDAVQGWSHDLALFVGSSQVAPDKHDRAEAAAAGLADLFRSLIRARRREPGEDLISALAARDDLADEALAANCMLLLFAGHETTTGLLANGLMRLIRHPDQQRLLRREPERAPAAVEEMLRFDSPAPAVSRIAREEVALRGARIRPGERLFLMLNAANRDPEAFPDPDRFDIARQNGRQIAFGFGIHFCVGAPLARLEAALALPRLMAGMEEIELAANDLTWRDGVSLRGLVSMPIRFRPPGAAAS